MWRIWDFRSWEHETSLNKDHRTWQNSTQSGYVESLQHVESYMALVGTFWSLRSMLFWIFDFAKINPKYFARVSKFHIILLYLIFQLPRWKWGPYH
jgi:hypothetical protein